MAPGVNVIAINAGPPSRFQQKRSLLHIFLNFAEEMALYSLRAGVRYDVVHAHYWLSGWVAELATSLLEHAVRADVPYHRPYEECRRRGGRP